MPKNDKRERVTAICQALPSAEHKHQGDHTIYRVRGKVFAYFLDNHHGDGIVSVCVKSQLGENADRARLDRNGSALQAFACVLVDAERAREALPLLARAGVVPEPAFGDEKSRALRFATDDPAIELIRVRAFDVATFVAHGAAQLGIVGSDVLGSAVGMDKGMMKAVFAAHGLPNVPHRLVTHRLKMQGFIVLDSLDRWPAAVEELAGWVRSGELRVVEDVVDGLDSAPEALIGLLAGANVGKRMVRVAPDP